MSESKTINLSDMSLEDIRDYILKLHAIIDRSKHGITLHPEDNEFLEVVFQDESIKAVSSIVNNARREIFEFADMHYIAGVTGGMRWEFSQEAAIVFDADTGHHEYL